MNSDLADKDLYAVLGVPATATSDDIRKAYRALAKQLHPDTNHGADAAERFKDVSAAYQVLGNEQSRTEYDRLRAAARTVAAPPGGPDIDLGDLLAGMFRQGRAHRGGDLKTRVTVSFLEAITGTTIQLKVPGGPTADGQPAPKKTINVKIPAGVANGARIKVPGRGVPGGDGVPAGDLYLRILVAPHPVFGRNGDHLTLTVPITVDEAVLGAELQVPTLAGGTVKLKLSPGTRPGSRFRIKGQGVNVGGRQGDLVVTVELTVPKSVPEPAIEALKEYARLSGQDPRGDLMRRAARAPRLP